MIDDDYDPYKGNDPYMNPNLPLPPMPTAALPLPPAPAAALPVNPAQYAVPPGLPPLPGQAPPAAAAASAPVAAVPLKRAPVGVPMSIEAAGFEDICPPLVPRLILSTQANEKCGKTHFALDTAPGDVAIISFDTGTKDIVITMRAKHPHKKYHLLQFKPPKSMVAKGEMTQQDAIIEWDRCKAAIRAVCADRRIRTLVLDTASEMWELCRLAILGKLEKIPPLKYVDANNEFRDWIKDIKEETQGLNLILIHKVKPEYAASPNGMGNKTGKFERQGMGDVPFLSDINGENIKYEDPTGATVGSQFGFKVYNSRLEPGVVGGRVFWNQECTFEVLAMYCWPETAGTNYWREIGRK